MDGPEPPEPAELLRLADDGNRLAADPAPGPDPDCRECGGWGCLACLWESLG